MPDSAMLSWITDSGCLDPGDRPTDAPGLRAQKERRFARFCALPESDLITDILWHYIRNVPRYLASERETWSLSCLPGGSAGTRLAVVSMRTMEVIVAGRPTGFINVSEKELLRGFGDWEVFWRDHPRVTMADTAYRDAGFDQVQLIADLPTLHDTLLDERISRAIRVLTARVSQLGKTLHGRGHCPQLADLALDSENPACRAGRPGIDHNF